MSKAILWRAFMEKVKMTAGLLGILVLFGVVSCASTPPPAEPPAPAPAAAPVVEPVQQPAKDPDLEPPDQAALGLLEAAKARAEAARTRALDFFGSEFFVQDWDSAESQYALAKEQEKSATVGDVRGSIGRYDQTSAAYDRIFENALPLCVQALEEGIITARSEAMDAGIAVISPDHVLAADDTVDKALDLYEAKDYYPAAINAVKAWGMYQIMKIGTEAYKARQEILDYGFVKYDPDNYAVTEETAFAGLDIYDALVLVDTMDVLTSGEDLLLQAEEVRLGYNLVLDTGWRSYATERQASAGAERQNALDFKANVAVRVEYNAAQELYNRAASSYQAQHYAEAADLYFQAEFSFAASAGTAAQKRGLAEDAIQTAQDRAATSEATARSAEVILEGGTR
jgi:hypothetical protein